MADYRALEGASRTLRSLLRDRMQEAVPVTLLPPDVEPDDVEGRRVNLYLFEVKEHAQLKNQMAPAKVLRAPTAGRRSRSSSTICSRRRSRARAPRTPT